MIVAFSNDEQRLIYQLSDMVDELYAALGQIGEDTVQCYQSLHKVKNILKAKDPKGMKNVKQHLMMDFRIIEDRQLGGAVLDDVLERLYQHVNTNGIFKPS